MTEQQKRKQTLRAFMRDHYSDERLAMLLAHAQDGKLSYVSCCCFIGLATWDGDHAMAGYQGAKGVDHPHYRAAELLPGALRAENAYLELYIPAWLGFADGNSSENYDVARRRILIPILRAEIRRRDRLAKQKSDDMLRRASGMSDEQLRAAGYNIEEAPCKTRWSK